MTKFDLRYHLSTNGMQETGDGTYIASGPRAAAGLGEWRVSFPSRGVARLFSTTRVGLGTVGSYAQVKIAFDAVSAVQS